MNIDVSAIISAKLAQLEADGVIKKKIEETLEKTLMQAITDEINSYSFRSGIQKQVKESISNVAEDCGFSAYNGFIVERVKAIVQEISPPASFGFLLQVHGTWQTYRKAQKSNEPSFLRKVHRHLPVLQCQHTVPA